MDEDSDSTNWVLVDGVDCAEEALTLNSSTPLLTDSDQESDGSISIISDHPTDSYSEEEHEPHLQSRINTPNEDNYNNCKESLLKEDEKLLVKEQQSFVKAHTKEEDEESLIKEVQECFRKKEPVQVLEVESSNLLDGTYVQDATVAQIQSTDNESLLSCDGGVSSARETSSQNWAYTNDIPTYLDCSQEPILEVSPNESQETEVYSESSSNSEYQAIAQKSSRVIISNPSNRETVKEGALNRIGLGILISVIVLVGSHYIQRHPDVQENTVQSTSEYFVEGLADSESARRIINICIERQKSKGEYAKQAVERCAIKRLKRKNKEEAMKRTEIYLQMKERILEIREKELAEKEREIVRKWRKRNYDQDIEKKKDTKKFKESQEMDKIYKKKNFKEKKDHKWSEKKTKISDKMKSVDRHEDYGDFEVVKDENKYKNVGTENSYENENILKKFDGKYNEKKLNKIKERVKKSYKKSNLNDKTLKNLNSKDDPYEELYIKYNPLKNTIELINLTTLPHQDSLLIKNGNKTINGQWYFSLYGSSRNNMRNRKTGDWYFKRAHERENKRDKAKWYFDYMSARDYTRYYY